MDEAQDSSPLEIAVMAAACQMGLQVCCVLDPRQSIYGFRGARVHGLLDALEVFPGCHHHLLSVNRRSGAPIVGLHNDFSQREYAGLLATPMKALTGEGTSFHAVECPGKAETLQCLGAALGAINGLPRSARLGAPRPDAALRRALGLPACMEAGERLAVVLRTNRAAREVYEYLVSVGYAPELLATPKGGTREREILYGLLHPSGTTAGPAKVYGMASPLCLVFDAIRQDRALTMDRDSDGFRALDGLIGDLRSFGMEDRPWGRLASLFHGIHAAEVPEDAKVAFP